MGKTRMQGLLLGFPVAGRPVAAAAEALFFSSLQDVGRAVVQKNPDGRDHAWPEHEAIAECGVAGGTLRQILRGYVHVFGGLRVSLPPAHAGLEGRLLERDVLEARCYLLVLIVGRLLRNETARGRFFRSLVRVRSGRQQQQKGQRAQCPESTYPRKFNSPQQRSES